MTTTRREMLHQLGIGALAFSPAVMPNMGFSKAMGQTPKRSPHTTPKTVAPRVPVKPTMIHPPHHHKSVTKHLHKHHKYAHHYRHPHHKAKSLRAISTLNTPGNRHDLALTMWGEARGYGELGMRCIGHVIMNRVAAEHKAFGHGVHGVCRKHKQFSCWNSGDPNRERMFKLPTMDDTNPDWIAFMKADELAGRILAGVDKDNTGGATYYVAEGWHMYWRDDMIPVGVMFGHEFFKPKPHLHHIYGGKHHHDHVSSKHK